MSDDMTTDAARDATVDGILDFWFGAPGDEGFGENRAIWWTVDAAFDAQVRERLGDLQADAAAGRLDDWAATPRSVLALLLLLDQAPRNLFRGTARAWATDARAREANLAVSARSWRKLSLSKAKEAALGPHLNGTR